jgi:hypothetical protein
LDNDARWAGDSLILPQLGVQLHVETNALLRNAQLVAAGVPQSYAGWRQLEEALAYVVRQTRAAPNRHGWSFIVVGAAMMIVVTLHAISDPAAVLQALNDMLRR